MVPPFSEALDARDCGLNTASLTTGFNLVEFDVPGLVPAADGALLFILHTFHLLRLSVASRDASMRGPAYLGNNAN